MATALPSINQDAPGGVMPKTEPVSAGTGEPGTVSHSRAAPGSSSAPPSPSALRQKTHPAVAAESFRSPPLTAVDLDVIARNEARFRDEIEGWGPDPLHADYDLTHQEKQRCDEPDPDEFLALFPPPSIPLEKRGLTSQAHLQPFIVKPKPNQLEFWARQTVYKNTVAAKLREVGRSDLSQTLETCHSTYTVVLCNDCGRVRRFPNRCDSFFCPECQPRLSHDRKQAVEWWTRLIQQPKHVVLTVRNIPDMTKEHVQEFKRWWGRLRRRAFARNWIGGFYSIEVTNENRGWHLHLHALVEAKWIDKDQLKEEWRSVNGGAGYIVEVKDCRREDYLRELVKYSVKGSALAKWHPNDIATFITAFTGVRAFGVFGTLYGARTRFAEFIAEVRETRPSCECGSSNCSFFSEVDWFLKQERGCPGSSARPPTDKALQQAFWDEHLSPHQLRA